MSSGSRFRKPAPKDKLLPSSAEARKLILDEFGRELDEDGQVVPMKPQASRVQR